MLGDKLGKLKGLVPPSSRSFHAVAKKLIEEQGTIIRLLYEQRDMNAALSAKQQETIDELHRLQGWLHDELYSTLELQISETRVRDEHVKFYLEAIHRQEGESHYDARKRLFANLEPATGTKRMMQLAATRLMRELDAILTHLDIEYWFAYGTLVATLYRSGSIPWDDDIDICIRREDIDKLKNFLAQANGATANKDASSQEDLGRGYQVTTIYDRNVFCRQVRFSPIDEDLPVFIDLSIWDASPAANEACDKELRRLRLELMHELGERTFSGKDELAYWAEQPFLRATGSGACIQSIPVNWDAIDPEREQACVKAIEATFDAYQQKAIELGLILEAHAEDEQSGTYPPAITYALDNIYDAPWRRITWPSDLIFPTHRAPYEDCEFRVPHKEFDVCDECYPGSPYLPNDIFTHYHMDKESLSKERTMRALAAFVEE